MPSHQLPGSPGQYVWPVQHLHMDSLSLCRTIQYNMLKMRDHYLHTNCLAALANMCGIFKHFHKADVPLLCRTIQYNMLKMCDRYLHTNCLAALANMSGLFKHLHMINLLSLSRTIQYNMLKKPDYYLHTNCPAALTNWLTCLAWSSIST
jgi:hypothetical protein